MKIYMLMMLVSAIAALAHLSARRQAPERES
jgi:hypothetical protein